MSDDDSQSMPELGRGAAWDLSRHIQEQIESGVFPRGSRLPTHRELMQKYQLTKGTVSYAMSILAAQGYVERRHGSGVYVRPADFRTATINEQTATVALVVPELESGEYAALLAGMEQGVRKNREHLIVVSTGGSGNKQADVLMQLIDREVAGVAIIPSGPETSGYQLRHLRKVNMPLVLLHNRVAGVEAPFMEFPRIEIGRLAGSELFSLDHRRVGAVLEAKSELATQYLGGLRVAAQNAGCEWSDDLLVWCDVKSDLRRIDPKKSAGKCIEELLLRPNRPTAIFAGSYHLGCEVLMAAHRLGLRVPNDLSLIWGGHQRRGALRLSSVTVDEFQGGRQAYEMLWEARRGIRPTDQLEIVPFSVSVEITETCASSAR